MCKPLPILIMPFFTSMFLCLVSFAILLAVAAALYFTSRELRLTIKKPADRGWWEFETITTPKSANWGFHVGAMILAIVMIGDLWFTTNSTWKSLTSLTVSFSQSAAQGPIHRYQNERGSTYDFGGTLDEVIETRDQMTRQLGVTGFLVNWHTSEWGPSFSGVYFHGSFILLGLAGICLDILIILVLNTRFERKMKAFYGQNYIRA